MTKDYKRWGLWLAGLAAVLAAPWFLNVVATKAVAQFAVFAMFAVSFNLLLSFTGLLSFGHALFFGAGGYATALAIIHVPGIPLLAALLLGGLAAALIALICSPFLVRCSGTAFAMLTLAFGQLMLVLCLKFREITQGEDGITFTPPRLFYLINMDNTITMYYFVMVVAGLGIFLMWYFTRTPLGSIMISLRDNTTRVEYLGFKVPQTKAIIFVISGGFAGIAGSLFALLQNLVSTDGFLTIAESFIPIMAVLIGGIGTFAGPIIGMVILMLIEDLGVKFTSRVELVTGVIFVLAVLFAPGGVIHLYDYSKQKLLKRVAARRAGEEPA
jgi:branched-chain amino acid transport system permease protein